MTTLHLDRAALEEAVAPYPVVAAIEVRPDVPNGLHIHVRERRAVAMLVSGSQRVPVAADGSIAIAQGSTECGISVVVAGEDVGRAVEHVHELIVAKG